MHYLVWYLGANYMLTIFVLKQNILTNQFPLGL